MWYLFLSLNKYEKNTEQSCYNTVELILPYICPDTLPMDVFCFAKSIPDGSFPVHAVFYKISICRMCCFGQNLISDVTSGVPMSCFSNAVFVSESSTVLVMELSIYKARSACRRRDCGWSLHGWGERSVPKFAISFMERLGSDPKGLPKDGSGKALFQSQEGSKVPEVLPKNALVKCTKISDGPIAAPIFLVAKLSGPCKLLSDVEGIHRLGLGTGCVPLFRPVWGKMGQFRPAMVNIQMLDWAAVSWILFHSPQFIPRSKIPTRWWNQLSCWCKARDGSVLSEIPITKSSDDTVAALVVGCSLFLLMSYCLLAIKRFGFKAQSPAPQSRAEISAWIKQVFAVRCLQVLQQHKWTLRAD